MPPSGSPTLRRRRLAAELRKLRANRKGGEIARAIGWSPSKISRAESGRESLPPVEIEKLIDFYEAAEPLRGRLLGLAEDAVQRGWWDDYADILPPEYLEFIGLEDEATSCFHWQVDAVPGLLQTADYVREMNTAYQDVAPTIPLSVYEGQLEVRMRRQERLTREPVLRFSTVLDQSVLLRQIGGRDLMRAQLRHLAAAAELPNVDVRVLPLDRPRGLVTSSFAILRFGAESVAAPGLSDVVSTEALTTELYVEGETDTRLYSIFFESLQRAALSPAESRQLIIETMERDAPRDLHA